MIPTKANDALMQRYVDNIVAAYRACTPEQKARGRQWYAVAHDLAMVIGNGNVPMGAGILAALSAQKRWEINVSLANDAANGNVHGHTEQTLAKVRAMLEGANPTEILPMQLKTGNFYRCIVDPTDPDPIVIDRHAHDIAVGERYHNKDRGLGNVTRYATLAMAYRLAARVLDILASDCQASVWCRQVELFGGTR